MSGEPEELKRTQGKTRIGQEMISTTLKYLGTIADACRGEVPRIMPRWRWAQALHQNLEFRLLAGVCSLSKTSLYGSVSQRIDMALMVHSMALPAVHCQGQKLQERNVKHGLSFRNCL